VKTMAEVIREASEMHELGLFEVESKILADALTAAGFGLVKEAQAGAWDEGMTFASTLLNAEELTPSFRKDNPYRAASIEESQ
jgi:hypothetical protein